MRRCCCCFLHGRSADPQVFQVISINDRRSRYRLTGGETHVRDIPFFIVCILALLILEPLYLRIPFVILIAWLLWPLVGRGFWVKLADDRVTIRSYLDASIPY